MVSNTIQHPSPPPHRSYTLYIMYFHFGGGGGGGRWIRKKVRGAIVHKAGSNAENTNMTDRISSLLTLLNTTKDDF